ncbi:MAG TPA: hypothetical protein VFU63_07880 [Ktedonobacterales bacterium]|nr:hypothetical protein [Ktedonobacterales bacterium]
MRRLTRFTQISLSVALAALFSIGFAGAALAHGGPGITITPDTVMPGDTVDVTAAEVSSPGGDITITVIGNGVNAVLPMQKASDDGDFEGKVTIPSNLVPGSYQLEVKGDKAALTGDFDVSGAGSTTQTAAPAIQIRQRPLFEMLLIAAIFGVLAGAGILFARTANHRARTAS